MTEDRILASFLAHQAEEGRVLAESSDILELTALGASPPDRFIARFHCRGLVRAPGGDVGEAGRFDVGVWFPRDYLRRADPGVVLTWLGPRNVFHPNISDRMPFICVGRLAPGTPLVDLLYQCYEIITWQKVTMREDDALNPAACAWARENRSRYPVDRRPLKRRSCRLRVRAQGGEA